MKKRFFGTLLIICMVILLLPVGSMVVFAAVGDTILINGIQVTSDNSSDILGGGEASFDTDTKTLTLKGDITTLSVAEDCTLVVDGSINAQRIEIKKGNVTLKGINDGKITFTKASTNDETICLYFEYGATTIMDIIIDGGNSTFSDSGIKHSFTPVLLRNHAHVTLEKGATIQNFYRNSKDYYSGAWGVVGVYEYFSGSATLTIKDGAVIENNKSNAGGIVSAYGDADTTIKIQGGTIKNNIISGEYDGVVCVRNGNTEISGGDISAGSGAYAVYTLGSGETLISGGEFSGTQAVGVKFGSFLTISGGSFAGTRTALAGNVIFKAPDGKAVYAGETKDTALQYNSRYTPDSKYVGFGDKTDITDAPSSPEDKKVMLGTTGISLWDEYEGCDYLYFGNDGTAPIKWRILDKKTNTGEEGLFLLSEYCYGVDSINGIRFNNDCHYHYVGRANCCFRGEETEGCDGTNEPYAYVYQGSNAQAWCKTFEIENFLEKELEAILATTKSDKYFDSYDAKFIASENILNNDKVFFLSGEEASNSLYGFVGDYARKATLCGTSRGWWLRSPPYNNTDYVYQPSQVFMTSVGHIDEDGDIGTHWNDMRAPARPAFNIDGSRLLFTSPAVNGEDFRNEWKATVLDSTRAFSVEECAVTASQGQKIEINYSGAEVGENEYVSAVIVDDSGNVLYYKHLAKNSPSGKATITVPDTIPDGTYTINVFSEQINGDFETDYASAFEEITLTASTLYSGSCGENLTWELTGSGSLTISGTGSMQEYSSDSPWIKNPMIKEVTVEYGVESISKRSFVDCTQLQKIKINAEISKIDEYTFYGCSALNSIELPGTITEIGNCAFYKCNALTDIYFYGTESQWQAITVGSANTAFQNAEVHFITTQGKCGDNSSWKWRTDGTLFIVGHGAMHDYGDKGPWKENLPIKKLVVESGITDISVGAFHSCSDIESVQLPRTLKSIGNAAFYKCTGITDVYYDGSGKNWDEITIGSGNTRLETANLNFTAVDTEGSCGTNAYWKWERDGTLTISGSGRMEDYTSTPYWQKNFNVKKVVVKSGITYIGAYAFYYCSDLVSAEIPYSVREMGKAAFYGCKLLSDVYYYGDEASWQKIVIGSANSRLDSATVHYKGVSSGGSCGENITWTIENNRVLKISGTGSMDDYSEENPSPWYANANIKEIVIEDGITHIGSCAFVLCDGVERISISDSVNSIGSNAFEGCSALKEIVYLGIESDWSKVDVGTGNPIIGETGVNYLVYNMNMSIDGNVVTASFKTDSANIGDMLIVAVYSGQKLIGTQIYIVDESFSGEKIVKYDASSGEKVVVMSVDKNLQPYANKVEAILVK